MCPACLSTIALFTAGAGSTGGLTALLALRLCGKKTPKRSQPRLEPKPATSKEKPR